MPDILLHHFPMSPYAQKVRAAFGVKGLAWRSVDIPNVMPKPDLTALTGGYRNTPVMQIGADIYCDTQCILRELDARHPAPSLLPAGTEGLAWLLFAWADRPFYATVNALMFGVRADSLPEEFVRDRQVHRGYQIDLKQFQREIPQWRRNLAAQLGWLEEALGRGHDYLLGPALSVADLGVWGPVWQMGKGDPEHERYFAPFPKLTAWAERMRDYGIGEPMPLTSGEAVEVARAAEPLPCTVEPDASGLAAGQPVTVTPDDKGKVPVAGRLAGLSAQRISIAREDPRAGQVTVHFPRAGFQVAVA